MNNISAKIRVDADPNMGLGHLIRCIALAHMIKESFQISFWLYEPSVVVLDIIKNEGFVALTLNSEAEFINTLSEKDVAIIDGYHFDLSYQQKVKAKGSWLICIDDLHQGHFVADLVINHAPGITEIDYKSETNTRFCLGPDFALIRPDFLKEVLSTVEREGIFVCLGGSDPLSLTKKVLESLSRLTPTVSVNLVLGGVNDRKAAFSLWASGQEMEVNIYNGLNACQMANLMRESKFAIVPSSGVLMESIAMGLTPLIGYFVDNQMDMYNAWKELGLYTLGDLRLQEDFEKRLKQFNFDLQSNNEQVSQLIDGKSGKRLRRIILDEVSKR